jgi:hypothetical protein
MPHGPGEWAERGRYEPYGDAIGIKEKLSYALIAIALVSRLSVGIWKATI